MLKKTMLICLVVIFFVTTSGLTEIKSQWRGPNRDGVYPEKNLLTKWSPEGPKLVWSVDGLGEGFSSAVVTSDRVLVTGTENKNATMFCFDINGKQLWKKTFGEDWSKSYPGTRSTATVVDNFLYITTAVGIVYCLDAKSGAEVWSLDMQAKFGAEVLRWGITESILIDGNYAYCTPGGSKATVVKLNRMNGDVVWTCKANGENSAYCSPLLVKHGATNLLLTMVQKSIIGINADNGKLLWTHPHVTKYDINPNTPYYKDGYVFCTSGYGTGSVMLKLNADGSTVKEVWRNSDLDSQIDAFVGVDGFIYGAGHSNKGWFCVDWKTGKTKYQATDLKKGNVVFADGMMYIYSEQGEVALVKPNPEKFEVVSSFEVTQGTAQHWAHLVVKDGKLYVRHGDTLLVYSVSK